MNAQDIKQAIDAIEQATDKAVASLKNGQVSADLQQRVQELHQLARTKRELNDEAELKQAALDIEQAADRAKEACSSGGPVDPDLQQAVKNAHQQASQLKHKLQDAT